MLLETINGSYFAVTREFIRRMTRAELERHLEARGFAVYDDESTAELRACALADYDNEDTTS